MRAIREGVVAEMQQAFAQMESHMTDQLRSEMTLLHDQIIQLTQQLAQAAQEQKNRGEEYDRWLIKTVRETLQEHAQRSRPWWPWRR